MYVYIWSLAQSIYYYILAFLLRCNLLCQVIERFFCRILSILTFLFHFFGCCIERLVSSLHLELGFRFWDFVVNGSYKVVKLWNYKQILWILEVQFGDVPIRWDFKHLIFLYDLPNHQQHTSICSYHLS